MTSADTREKLPGGSVKEVCEGGGVAYRGMAEGLQAHVQRDPSPSCTLRLVVQQRRLWPIVCTENVEKEGGAKKIGREREKRIRELLA